MRSRLLLRALLFVAATAGSLCGQETNSDHRFFDETKVRADQGDAAAECFIGDAYSIGMSAAEDAVEAVKWYRKAAEQGFDMAQYKLGYCYFEGSGVAKDLTEAAKWYRKAAEQGYSEAQVRLAFCFMQGAGVPKDGSEACAWLRKAADGGSVLAQSTLAGILRRGGFPPFIVVEKDMGQAATLYLRAAKQGDGDAQIAIGDLFAKGEGVLQDFVEAYKWFNIAATSTNAPLTNGVVVNPPPRKLTPGEEKERAEILASVFETTAERARKARADLMSKMTHEQIADAQELARKFKPIKEAGSRRSN